MPIRLILILWTAIAVCLYELQQVKSVLAGGLLLILLILLIAAILDDIKEKQKKLKYWFNKNRKD